MGNHTTLLHERASGNNNEVYVYLVMMIVFSQFKPAPDVSQLFTLHGSLDTIGYFARELGYYSDMTKR